MEVLGVVLFGSGGRRAQGTWQGLFMVGSCGKRARDAGEIQRRLRPVVFAVFGAAAAPALGGRTTVTLSFFEGEVTDL
jgi:hypothetical protein